MNTALSAALLVGGMSQMREFVKEADIYKRERLVNLKIFPYVSSKVWVAMLLAFYVVVAEKQGVPMEKLGGTIQNRDWWNIGGGDGFWAFTDPKDPDLVFVEFQGGEISRRRISVRTRGARWSTCWSRWDSRSRRRITRSLTGNTRSTSATRTPSRRPTTSRRSDSS